MKPTRLRDTPFLIWRCSGSGETKVARTAQHPRHPAKTSIKGYHRRHHITHLVQDRASTHEVGLSAAALGCQHERKCVESPSQGERCAQVANAVDAPIVHSSAPSTGEVVSSKSWPYLQSQRTFRVRLAPTQPRRTTHTATNAQAQAGLQTQAVTSAEGGGDHRRVV